MGSRTWIKIYCDSWLEGSLKDDPLELRGLWIGLLALAGSGKYGDDGIIKVRGNIGLEDRQLGKIFSITTNKFSKLKNKLVKLERIFVDSNNIITILNWGKYQSEYLRQKPYREAKLSKQKLQQIVTTVSYTGEGDREGEKRLRVDEFDSLNKSNTILKEERTLENICRVYGENVGAVTPLIEQDLKTIAIDPQKASHFDEAVKSALDYGSPNLAYIKKVLENWGNPKPQKNTRPIDPHEVLWR